MTQLHNLIQNNYVVKNWMNGLAVDGMSFLSKISMTFSFILVSCVAQYEFSSCLFIIASRFQKR